MTPTKDELQAENDALRAQLTEAGLGGPTYTAEPGEEGGEPVFGEDGLDQYGRTRRWYELFGPEAVEVPAEG